jgi:hypothetical protein
MKKLSEYSIEEIQELEPQIVAMLLDKWDHVKATGKALELAAKRLIDDGNTIPNWKLKKGSVRRKVSADSKAVAEAMMGSEEIPIKPSDLMDICSFSAKDLAELVGEKSGATKRRSNELLTELLGSLLTESQDAPSLQREKNETADP